MRVHSIPRGTQERTRFSAGLTETHSRRVDQLNCCSSANHGDAHADLLGKRRLEFGKLHKATKRFSRGADRESRQ
jgi:hypothetical protein